MNFAAKSKLARFLTAHARKHLLLTVILYVGILSIILFPVSMEENAMAWFGGYFACPVICIFLTRILAKSFLSVRRQFSALEAEGQLDKIVQDFSSADREMGGNLYVGKLGLYGKGSDAAALYRDMRQVYSVLSDRRGRNPRDLRYVNTAGEDKFLCELDPIGQSNTEIEQLYRRVAKKNPHIQCGQ